MFTNAAMIDYMNDFQKSKFANILTYEFDHSEPGGLIKFCVYFPSFWLGDSIKNGLQFMCSHIITN